MEERTLKEFFESIPPGKEVIVGNIVNRKHNSICMVKPKLQLHCSSNECQGVRFFSSMDEPWLDINKINDKFITFFCCNCKKSYKTFSIHTVRDKETDKWKIFKYGEYPAFGPPIPTRAFKLIGGERELFLLGRKSENQGMGIGAFVYYRRVIENQKSRIFDELIRVISKISPNDEVLKDLEEAKKEIQFTKAIDSIKHALPQSLYINGYNPLTLLHSALSEGVHVHSDDECLELASSVRTVLFEFAERLGQALKEEAELNNAINRLANKRNS